MDPTRTLFQTWTGFGVLSSANITDPDQMPQKATPAQILHYRKLKLTETVCPPSGQCPQPTLRDNRLTNALIALILRNRIPFRLDIVPLGANAFDRVASSDDSRTFRVVECYFKANNDCITKTRLFKNIQKIHLQKLKIF